MKKCMNNFTKTKFKSKIKLCTTNFFITQVLNLEKYKKPLLHYNFCLRNSLKTCNISSNIKTWNISQEQMLAAKLKTTSNPRLLTSISLLPLKTANNSRDSLRNLSKHTIKKTLSVCILRFRWYIKRENMQILKPFLSNMKAHLQITCILMVHKLFPPLNTFGAYTFWLSIILTGFKRCQKLMITSKKLLSIPVQFLSFIWSKPRFNISSITTC